MHFTDTVGEGPDAPPMSFDYRLRPGVATTTNALRLMRLIGLELEETGDGRETEGGRREDDGMAGATPERRTQA